MNLQVFFQVQDKKRQTNYKQKQGSYLHGRETSTIEHVNLTRRGNILQGLPIAIHKLSFYIYIRKCGAGHYLTKARTCPTATHAKSMQYPYLCNSTAKWILFLITHRLYTISFVTLRWTY